MAASFGAIAVLCIVSASALGCSIVLTFFFLMWCGCCHVSESEDDNERRHDREVVLHNDSNDGQPAVEPERKGIPLNSKPPRLTPEQELLRDKALEKYKRRKARQERRRARQAAREARLSQQHQQRCREGGLDGGENEDEDNFHHRDNYGNDYDDDGQSSVTSRTTLTSHATTVRTASTAAYGRGAYLLPPPHLCGVDMDLEDEDDERGSHNGEVRSVHSRSSRRSSGTTKSHKSSQSNGGGGVGGGTVATIKSYMRHRQRQRLRRREEQQQMDLFNQWAEAQMASSSELSPSSKSSAASSDGGNSRSGTASARGRRRSGGRGRRSRAALDSSVNVNNTSNLHLNNTMSSAYGGEGHLDYWHPSPSQQQQQPRHRSSSVASSAPRPPEEVLGEEHFRYPFMAGNGADGQTNTLHREQEHLQAGYPASPNMLRVHPEFGPPLATPTTTTTPNLPPTNGEAAVPSAATPANTNLYSDPNGSFHQTQQLQQQPYLLPPPQSPTQQPQPQPQPPQQSSSSNVPPPPPPRRAKRTWKDVEHNVALSGFFNSPANNSFGGMDAAYDDGEAPAPFHPITSPTVEPSHSPLGYPHQRRE